MPSFRGREYLINSIPADLQVNPAQTGRRHGDILVPWESGDTPGAPTDIYARILNPDGTVNAPDFIVNSTSGAQNALTTKTLPNGDGLVTYWQGHDIFSR